MFKNTRRSLSMFVLALIVLSVISPLASAGKDYLDQKDLGNVVIKPYERWDNGRGKYLEAIPVVLKEGDNSQYSNRDFSYAVAYEINNYLEQNNYLPWSREVLNEYEVMQRLMDAAEDNPDSNAVYIRVYNYSGNAEYDNYLAQRDCLGGDASIQVINVGSYYYGLKLKDPSAEQTEVTMIFPDIYSYTAYMIAKDNKEKWDNVKWNSARFVEKINSLSPGKVNTDKVMVYIGDKEYSYFIISNIFQSIEGWPTMAQDSYCFEMSSSAVRTYYDLEGARKILFDSNSVSLQAFAFSEANGVVMKRELLDVEKEYELHVGGWLITEEGNSWHRRAMPADINLKGGFFSSIIDISVS